MRGRSLFVNNCPIAIRGCRVCSVSLEEGKRNKFCMELEKYFSLTGLILYKCVSSELSSGIVVVLYLPLRLDLNLCLFRNLDF